MDVRIGHIGAGSMGKCHIRNFAAVDGVTVAAVCDVNEETAKAVAEEFGATAYTDYRKMLDKEKLDAVCVSTPPFAHGQIEFDIIDLGLPFLVDKPVALGHGEGFQTAREIDKAVKKKGIITSAGYQLRYTNSALMTREYLKAKTVAMVRGVYWCDTGFIENSWMRYFDRSGSQIVEQTTHTIDMMRFLIGDVEAVTAYSENRSLPGCDCPDVWVVNMRFKNGALGSLTSVWSLKSGWNANLLDIIADCDWIKWDAGSVPPQVQGRDETDAEGGEEPEELPQLDSIEEVFAQAVHTKDGSKILSPYSDGLRSLALSAAMVESARTKKEVFVDDMLKG